MFIVFFDLETTSKFANRAEIIQIAAIAYEINGNNWTELDEFERKVKFDISAAEPEALQVNSYDQDTWLREAEEPAKVLVDFNLFIKPYRDVARTSRGGKTFHNLAVGGHNIEQYDLQIIRRFYKAQNEFCPIDFQMTFDSLSYAKPKIYVENDLNPKPENLKLETLCNYFGIDTADAHDALADVRMSARLYYKLSHLNQTEVNNGN